MNNLSDNEKRIVDLALSRLMAWLKNDEWKVLDKYFVGLSKDIDNISKKLELYKTI